jgi:hypothetical protein
MVLRAIKNEYAARRGFLVRVMAKELAGRDDDLRAVYAAEGFVWRPSGFSTLHLDLSPAPDQLRRRMIKGHRESLRFAERQAVTVEEGTDGRLFEAALGLYRQMKVRKKFVDFTDMREIAEASRDLPDNLKVRLAVCYHEGEPVAAIGWAPLGDTGLPVTASTGDSALRLKSSFLLWWRMITSLKESGFAGVDLAGVHPDRNPGGFFFKKGLIGEGPQVLEYLGVFDISANRRSVILFRGADMLRTFYRNAWAGIGRTIRRLRKAGRLK